MENLYLSQTRFDEFQLDGRLLASIQEAGFEFCSRIQAETLPLALAGRDVAGQAQTGTGKTGAFLVSVFQHLLNNPLPNPEGGAVRSLILAPTRELAIQIARDAEELGKHTGLRPVLVYGGAGYDKQRRQFEDPVDVLIGTPGRVIDYWKQHVFTLQYAQALVLDEADRMFDMGFIADVRYLIRKMPPPTKRLNMLFSATLSQRVLELAYEHMNNPQQVQIEAESVRADNIAEHVYFPANEEKIPLLIGLIRKLNPFRAIVFVNTKHIAEKIDDYLRGNGVRSDLISGDVRQNKREKLLRSFESGEFQVLIATDVAARGLHIPDVSHVFNFDLPQMAEDYVHRIGRTARAGASGEAHSFACEDTAFYLPEIEEYTGKAVPVEKITADLLPTDLQRPQRTQRERAGRPHDNNRRGDGRRNDKRPTRHREKTKSDGEPPAAAVPAEAVSSVVEAAAEGNGEQKKRRRRRPRKKPVDGSTSSAQETAVSHSVSDDG
ncbi:DEAD/DEAH box helicase [Candidatus Thiothrix sp. Deng01]|uniref:ATP-dependent RNA helicase RhlB n=1 Tax=Candidatus Thiothrix phosphatis TaxID=3112415 RepID=A0ABU6D0X0_9GAMM|nr:DEAD/DEAH box helicase [Candidatus Thiothrix sp. Deng01]MEB4592685.1 DEAD/DEAH box helicase [Candidatus Thiothrix sp. Deng01]